jgi:hypothetical protein
VIAIGVYFLPAEITIYTILFSLAALTCAIAVMFFTFKKINFESSFYTIIALMISTALFGIPVLDATLQNNKDFKSLTSIKPTLEKEKTKMYSFKEYSPEVWYRYQALMPEIKPEDSTTFPKEKVFYVASNEDNFEELKKLGWTLNYVGTFDDNEEAKPSKNNTERKIHYVYKVTK